MSSLYPRSDHCDGTRFFNPEGPPPRSLREVLKWQRKRAGGSAVAWPKSIPPAPPVKLPAAIGADEVAATFIGHASYLLQFRELNVLTDPVFASRAGPLFFGPKRVCPPALRLGELPRIDVVVISHNHYDHLDLSSLRWLARQRRPQFVAPLGLKRWLEAHGVAPVTELDWWQTHWIGGLEITSTPAQHWSSRTPWDRCATLWCGYWLKLPAGAVYFCGDTGWGSHFATIRQRLGAPAVSLLPIGAYEPRWFMAPAHMNPDEAVRAHQILESRASLGMHHGTFCLTDEGIDAPTRALEHARITHGLADEAFRASVIGETVAKKLSN